MLIRARILGRSTLAVLVASLALLLLSNCSPGNQASEQADTGYDSSSTPVPLPTPAGTALPPDSGHVTGIVGEAITESARVNSPLIVIDKSLRRLYIYVSGKLDTTFRVAFGPNPVDDKVRARDGCTPEGLFTIGIRTNEPLSSYYNSLMLNYPLPEDAKRGRETGIIDYATYERILRAHQNARMPDQYTQLGGNICIHGCGSSRDWTLGRVALDSPDMKYLYSKVRLGDKCIIQK